MRSSQSFPKFRLGNRRRRTSVAVVIALMTSFVVAIVSAGGASGATGSNGTEQTFPQVTCTAKVGSATITQKQDISVWVIAPDSVAPGETFSVSLPSIPADLPSSAQGITITAYRDIRTTYTVNGASVVSASGTVDGPATINGNPTPAESDVTATTIMPTIPGPIPPGHLVPPNATAQIVAPANGTITISATQVTTTATLNVNGGTNAVATCPVPANTLTTTQVESSATSTTVAGSTTTASSTSTAPSTTTTTVPSGSTTTTTVPSGGSGVLLCDIGGAIQIRPGLKTTGATAKVNTATRLATKATMSACADGVAGTSAPATNGTFTSSLLLAKTAAGQTLPACSDLEHGTLTGSSTSKLLNGTTKIAALATPVAFGPMAGDTPITFDFVGTVTTKGPFHGMPLHVHVVTTLDRAGWNTACASTKGLLTLNFGPPSTYLVGTLPPPTTTTSSTSTTLATTTTSTTLATTTTTIPTTTTTVNPIPPAVGQAILAACNTLGATASLLGADITPLVFACQLIVAGQGSFLLQLFLQDPSLGCGFLTGVPVLNIPLLQAGCLTFAAAIQPFTSYIAPLIPAALFPAV